MAGARGNWSHYIYSQEAAKSSGAQITFFSFSPGPWPMAWCCPHWEWVLPLLLAWFIDSDKDVCLLGGSRLCQVDNQCNCHKRLKAKKTSRMAFILSKRGLRGRLGRRLQSPVRREQQSGLGQISKTDLPGPANSYPKSPHPRDALLDFSMATLSIQTGQLRPEQRSLSSALTLSTANCPGFWPPGENFGSFLFVRMNWSSSFCNSSLFPGIYCFPCCSLGVRNSIVLALEIDLCARWHPIPTLPLHLSAQGGHSQPRL